LLIEQKAPAAHASGAFLLSEFLPATSGLSENREDTYAFSETNIYDVKNENLIWSARPDTEVSNVNQELTRSFVRIMIDRLSADALIR